MFTNYVLFFGVIAFSLQVFTNWVTGYDVTLGRIAFYTLVSVIPGIQFTAATIAFCILVFWSIQKLWNTLDTKRVLIRGRKK